MCGQGRRCWGSAGAQEAVESPVLLLWCELKVQGKGAVLELVLAAQFCAATIDDTFCRTHKQSVGTMFSGLDICCFGCCRLGFC